MTIDKTLEQKRKFYKYGIIGTAVLFFATLIHIIDPVERIIQNELSVHPGSFLFNLWTKPPLEIFVKVYVFNITNAGRFLSGLDKKMKFVEIGPYVYQDTPENINITFNNNGTLSYYPTHNVKFIQSKSVGDPQKDLISMLNIPLLGISTTANEVNSLASFSFSTLAKTLHAIPILNLTVHDFLWGYEDKLIRLASEWVPNMVHFEKFGILDRIFDEGTNLVTMNLPEKINQIKHQHKIKKKFLSEDSLKTKNFEPDIEDYSIDTFNGSPGLFHWGYNGLIKTRCNTVRGAYEGTLFPKNMSTTDLFYVYKKSFCRTYPIKFSRSGKLWGLNAYWFRLVENVFDTDITHSNSSCYCENKVCLKKGLANIRPCYYNIPMSVSFPHFYNSDKSLLNQVEGLKPNAEKHDSEMIIQPDIGVPMKLNLRVQINLNLGDTKFNKEIQIFDNTVLPIIWLDLTIEELPKGLFYLLHLVFNVVPYFKIIMLFFLFVIGVLLIAFGFFSYFFLTESVQKKDIHSKMKDLRYSAVNMIPAIKRELLRET